MTKGIASSHFSGMLVQARFPPKVPQRALRYRLHDILSFTCVRDNLVDHYITYCQTGFRYQKTEAQEFATNPRKQEQASDFFQAVALDMMGLMVQEWQLELAWAQRIRE
jgi:hypothetical protein